MQTKRNERGDLGPDLGADAPFTLDIDLRLDAGRKLIQDPKDNDEPTRAIIDRHSQQQQKGPLPSPPPVASTTEILQREAELLEHRMNILGPQLLSDAMQDVSQFQMQQGDGIGRGGTGFGGSEGGNQLKALLQLIREPQPGAGSNFDTARTMVDPSADVLQSELTFPPIERLRLALLGKWCGSPHHHSSLEGPAPRDSLRPYHMAGSSHWTEGAYAPGRTRGNAEGQKELSEEEMQICNQDRRRSMAYGSDKPSEATDGSLPPSFFTISPQMV